jgi:hypothetical protein
MEMAIVFATPPWEIEKGMTPVWWNRWRVWKEEQPEQHKPKGNV